MGLLSKISGPAAAPPPRPIPKKPEPAPAPGILGEKGYRGFGQMKGEVKKPEFYKNIPGSDKKFSQKERVGLIDTLRKYSGQSFGLSEGKFDSALNKMRKEKMQAGYRGDYKKIKELSPKIKQLEAWRKGQKS